MTSLQLDSCRKFQIPRIHFCSALDCTLPLSLTGWECSQRVCKFKYWIGIQRKCWHNNIDWTRYTYLLFWMSLKDSNRVICARGTRRSCALTPGLHWMRMALALLAIALHCIALPTSLQWLSSPTSISTVIQQSTRSLVKRTAWWDSISGWCLTLATKWIL